MATVLLQFGVILVVVLMGFATSFFALFRDVYSFGETLLHLFKTILGDVELFDELEDISREQYAVVGYLLLVVFVIAVTIMLLNLLIAILSTAHADVHSNTQKEFKVSTARTVEHYRLAVELDILPAPFNLLQTLVSLPFLATRRQQSGSYHLVKRSEGQAIFWLAPGPIAIVGGTLLWIVSIPHVIALLRNNRVKPSFEYWLPSFCFSLAFIPGVPVVLAAMWLKEPFMWITRIYVFLSKGSSSVIDQQPGDDLDVQGMLKETGVTASELRQYLENPMIDPEVQRDEVDKSTTVEHVKLLRDRLEETMGKHSENTERRVSALHEKIRENFSNADELREEMQKKFSNVDHIISEFRNEMNGKLATILEVLEMSRISGLREGEVN